jgi:molybdenum cofactor cytidylyltransferase
MPFARTETVKALLDLAQRTNALVSPRFDGDRGHPLIVPGDLRDVILAAPDSAKLNEVLKPYSSRVRNLDVEDRGVIRDVDVVADLACPEQGRGVLSEAVPVRGRAEG